MFALRSTPERSAIEKEKKLIAKKFIDAGLSDLEIAHQMKVSGPVFRDWKKANRDFIDIE